MKEKLGDPKVLRSVEEAADRIAQNMQDALSRWQKELAEKASAHGQAETAKNTACGIDLRKGQHEGLITLETYEKIQTRLKEAAHVVFRKDIGEEFPLRGFVTCADCDHPMTSCWSTS